MPRTVTTVTAGRSSVHDHPFRSRRRSVEVDVVTAAVIDRPRQEVAAYSTDPDNATEWYRRIEAVEWSSGEPLDVGSSIVFVAEFLGRRLVYTYRVREMVPGQRLVMSTIDGPFSMETTYTWSDEPGGGTRMTLRNRGTPTGFSRVAVPFISLAMRRANAEDLRTLKAILEGSAKE